MKLDLPSGVNSRDLRDNGLFPLFLLTFPPPTSHTLQGKPPNLRPRENLHLTFPSPGRAPRESSNKSPVSYTRSPS